MDLKRIKDQKLYFCDSEEWVHEQLLCMEKLYDYNMSRPLEQEKRAQMLKDFFGGVGKNLYIEPPLHANWGRNTYWGDDCYANFNLTLVDDGDVIIGNNVLIAPNVVITTTGHPIEPNLRKRLAQFSVPVIIEDNVWIGAGAIIMPGVTIGENSVIGAGSIVTKSIPKNVIAVGNPCRVLREISQRDREYYYKDMKIDVEIEIDEGTAE